MRYRYIYAGARNRSTALSDSKRDSRLLIKQGQIFDAAERVMGGGKKKRKPDVDRDEESHGSRRDFIRRRKRVVATIDNVNRREKAECAGEVMKTTFSGYICARGIGNGDRPCVTIRTDYMDAISYRAAPRRAGSIR